MAWTLIVALVLASSVISYVLRERRHRNRWQLVALPSVAAGHGAYRQARVEPGSLAEAPGPLRAMVFSCILYGRAVTFAFIATALYLAGVPTEVLAVPTLHALLGYFVAGGGVGVLAALVLASLVMRAGSDLLVRDPAGAYRRTRATAIASVVLHTVVMLNAHAGWWLVGTGGRDASRSLHTTAYVAAAGLAHALALLLMAHVYRRELSVRRDDDPRAHDDYGAGLKLSAAELMQ
jgi:hypothetical protein